MGLVWFDLCRVGKEMRIRIRIGDEVGGVFIVCLCVGVNICFEAWI